MIPEVPGKTNSNESDAEKLTQELELELIQKRATWKQAGTRYKNIRTAAFLFLFLLISACLLGSFFVFSRVTEERSNQHDAATSAVPNR